MKKRKVAENAVEIKAERKRKPNLSIDEMSVITDSVRKMSLYNPVKVVK